MESRVSRHQCVQEHSQLNHGILVHVINGTAMVNQNPTEPDVENRSHECRVYHTGIASGLGHNPRVIFPTPADLHLGPVQELRHSRNDRSHLHRALAHTFPFSGLGHEDHIALMSFPVIALLVSGLIAWTSTIVVSDIHHIHWPWSRWPLNRLINSNGVGP